MQDLNKVLYEITQLTNHIETNYPELYQFLDENPDTIPHDDHPVIDKASLCQYLDSLNSLLAHYEETH